MSDAENVKDWLVKHYPVEAVFIDEISKNVNDIFQHLGTHPNFKTDEPKDMKFRIVKRSDTDYAELQMSLDAVLFMGGMAKAISDIILKQLLPNIQPETKKCSQCDTTNNKVANYCYQSANKFESV